MTTIKSYDLNTTQPNKSRATKPAPTIDDTKAKTEAKVAGEGHNSTAQAQEVAALVKARELADGHLKAALTKAMDAAKRMEGGCVTAISTAIVEYLKAKHLNSTNKTIIKVSWQELKEHCFDLANYRRFDKENPSIDTSNDSFETAVKRGVKAGLLIAEDHKGMTVKDNKIMAVSNAITPKLRVKNPATGKWQEVDNPSAELQAMPMRVIEAEFADKFKTANKRKPSAPGSKDSEAQAPFNTAAILGDGNMSERLTAMTKFIHAIADVKSPLSEGHLSNLVDIARDIDLILALDENKAKLGLDETKVEAAA